MMNKIGSSGIIWGVVIALIIVGIAGGYFYFGTPQTQVTADEACQLAPTMTVDSLDVINPGTSVSNQLRVIQNGVYVGTKTTSSEFARGDDLEVLVNGTSYIGDVIKVSNLKCGVNSASLKLKKLDGSPTVKVYDPDGTVLTDAATGGAGNLSTSANPQQLKITFTTPADEGVNGVVFVFEAMNTTVVDDMILSSESASVKSISKPEIHTAESDDNNALIKAYRVDNLKDDGGLTTFYLNIQPESAQTLAGDYYMTWYIEDTAVDDDGTFVTGIEDSDGTAIHVSAASSDYDWLSV